MPIPKLDKADNGYFYAYWSDNGRSRRKSMGSKDAVVAQERFAQWLLMRGAEDSEGQDIYTVEDAWVVYRKFHGAKVASPETLDYNWANLRHQFAALTVSAVRQDVVDAYVVARTAGRIGRAAKGPTIRKELGTLQAAMNFCTRRPHALYPASALEPIEMPAASEPRDRWLRTSEIRALMAAAAEMRRGEALSRLERFLWLALETAARVQAILDLTWDRVDFEAGVIHYDVPGRKKTKKGRAAVPPRMANGVA